MPKLSQLASDPELEVGGRAVTWERGPFKIPCRIARLWNSKMSEFLRERDPEALQASVLFDDDHRELMAEALARFVVLDIADLENDDGSELPYTWELGRDMLLNPELEDFLAFVITESAKASEYLRKEAEAAAGE